MNRLLARSKDHDLQTRLGGLSEALEIARDRLDAQETRESNEVLERAGERLELSPEATVVALAGATGSGKSSLFNLLAGVDLATVGVRRPTTATAQACVWGEDSAGTLLDWLQIPERHNLGPVDKTLDGMVLLDLPDHDSTAVSHRLQVDRLVKVVDAIVWVVDPQKYADASLHERYLKPLATHVGVMLMVLNQVDRLDQADRKRCMLDLERLLQSEGLGEVPVFGVSALTGEGLGSLRAALGRKVTERHAAVERLDADAAAAAQRLGRSCHGGGRPGRIEKPLRAALLDSMAAAAGVDTVASAVAKAHRHRAAKKVGWPFTRWLRRLRPDPLARLHLGASTSGGRTSLPAPTPVQRAQIETSTRSLVDGATGTLSDPWPDIFRRSVFEHIGALPGRLDRVVTGADLEEREPRWWSAASALQYALALVALAGLIWLTVLFGVAWLRLPDPPTPEIERIPLPTLLLIGGALLGILTSFAGRLVARVGAARRARSVRRRLRKGVDQLAEEEIVAPLEKELDDYAKFCAAIERAGG